MNKITTMLENTENEEIFIDASEIIVPKSSKMDILTAVNENVVATSLFLDDKYEEAMKVVKERIDDSVYHAIGYGFLHFMQACFSFEPEDVSQAIEVLKTSANVCNKRRRQATITNNYVTKIILRPNYNAYTEEEIHAELCYAECLLVWAMLTFFQNDNFISFIRGGLRIRTSYQIYKECQDMLEYRTWHNAELKDHFKSGVNLGLGLFNLVLSSLPKRFLKLLELIGFSGDKEVAHEMLETGHKMQNTVSGPYCTLVNIGFNVVIRYILGKGLDSFEYIERLMQPLLTNHPDSTLTLYFCGRLEHLKGNITTAIEFFKKSISKQVEWNKFKQVAYFELYFCHVYKGEYHKSIEYMEILRRESHWSKAIYNYMKASLMSMCEDLDDDERQEMIQLMLDVPKLMQRVAGKSVPPEKYICKRAERFIAQNNWLPLPAYEMMYVLNYFMVIKGKTEILDRILANVNQVLEEISDNSSKDEPYYMDNFCLVLFLKGVCLSYMGSVLLAEEIFTEIYENYKNINDSYIVSCALLELGLIYQQTRNYEQAVIFLNGAKKHTVFYTEFRIHQALQEIESERIETSKQNGNKFI